MKTAISVPDPLFQAGEQAARRLGLSRSELYAKALTAFLEEDAREDVTQSINRALKGAAPRLAPEIVQAQAASLGPDEGGLEEWVEPENLARRRPVRARS